MRLDIIAFLTATLIAIQARANGELSHLLGNPIQAATVSFGSGLIIITIFAATHHGMKQGLIGIKRAVTEGNLDRKSTRLNSSHVSESRMPSSA